MNFAQTPTCKNRQSNQKTQQKATTMTQTLLIELLTEELPPKALNNLGNSLAASIVEGLEKAELIEGAADYTAYASPRRLAVQVKNTCWNRNWGLLIVITT